MFAFNPPPRHTRLRSLVNRGFTPRSVEQLRGRIRELADVQIDARLADGRMDLVAEYAYPISVAVICEMIGAPVGDVPRIEGWAAAISARVDEGVVSSPDSARGADDAARGFLGYLQGLIDERRRVPRDDLVSRLLAVQRDADDLADEDIAATALLLFQAGHETTANMIGKGALALLQHPAELAKLRARPELAANATEELLRFDTPVQLTTKFASRDIPFHDRTIRAGDPVMLVWGAVNRDPERYRDPDRLDLERPDIDHHSFGMGAHYCLGAALARLELEQAIGVLVRRLPGLQLATDRLVYKPQLHLHGLATLPVAW
jgi:cytochrome P450